MQIFLKEALMEDGNNNKQRDSQSTAIPYYGVNASMFSEKEAKRIITDYNKTLEEIIKENDMLEMDNQQLERTIQTSSKQVCDYKTKNQEILIEQEYYSTIIKEYLEQMKQNQQLFEKLIVTIGENKKEENELLMNFEEDDQDNQKTFIPDAQHNIRKEIQHAKIEQFKLNTLLKYLANQNNQLKSELNKYILDKIKPKQCVVCGIIYNHSDNTEKSCIYHPGKIKYFSCRGCGKDEYNTCCLYCSECKKGCRMKKHMSSL